MPFQKVYECICDYCGECNYHIYDKSRWTLKKLREDGFVIARDGLYCCKDCYTKAKERKEKMNAKISNGR